MWWVGLVEGLGNAAVVTVLGWRIRSSWKTRWWSLLAFQASAVMWFASNIMYAVYFVMWERFEIDWWSGFHYDLTKGAQQLAIMLLPLAVLTLISQLFKDYRKAERRLANVHD